MKKKYLALLLSLSLMLSAFGCGKSNPVNDGTEALTDIVTTAADTVPEWTPPEFTPAINIYKDGKSDYTIICGADCLPSERYAAEELAKYFGLMTGYEFTVADDSEPEKAREILIGETNRTGSLSADERAALGDDRYVWRTDGEKLFIDGGRRGVLYGVYTLLEEYFGFRCYTPDCERVLPAEELTLPELDYTYQPIFEMTDYYEYSNLTESSITYRVKLGINGLCDFRIDAKYGGSFSYAPMSFVHTMGQYLPTSQYLEEHPEYFSIDDTGYVDISKNCGVQLCMTNPEVFDITLAEVRRRLAENPGARIISVSQNDCNGYCTCENCSRIINEEGGSAAAPQLRFVNAIADAIRDEYPDVVVDTLAYMFSEEPPTITVPRDNVCIRICAMSCDSSVCLDGKSGRSEVNSSFAANLEKWSKICKRLYVWHYVTDFSAYFAPFMNHYVLRDDIRYFAETGAVKGIFSQSSGQTTDTLLSNLRYYLVSRLYRDPYVSLDDYNAWIDEFFGAVCGKAGAVMREYFDYLIEKNKNKSFMLYSQILDLYPIIESSDENELSYANRVFIETLQGYIDRALSATEGDETAINAIERERVSVMYLDAVNRVYNAYLANQNVRLAEKYGLDTASVEAAGEQSRQAAADTNKLLYDEAIRLGFEQVTERVRVVSRDDTEPDFNAYPELWYGVQ